MKIQVDAVLSGDKTRRKLIQVDSNSTTLVLAVVSVAGLVVRVLHRVVATRWLQHSQLHEHANTHYSRREMLVVSVFTFTMAFTFITC